MAENTKAREFLLESESAFKTFKTEWESLAAEAPNEFMRLVRGGNRPYVSNGSSGRLSITSSTSKSYIDAAREYLQKTMETVQDKAQYIVSYIENFDKKLRKFHGEGIDTATLKTLVGHLNEWIAYISTMKFEIGRHDIELNTPDDITKIKKYWDKIQNA